MKNKSYKEIEAARKVLVASGTIDTFWHKDDIKARAKERDIVLNEEQVQGIADLLVKRHDASQGINWDVIDVITDIYLD